MAVKLQFREVYVHSGFLKSLSGALLTHLCFEEEGRELVQLAIGEKGPGFQEAPPS